MRINGAFRARRWRILPRLPQQEAEFIQVDRTSIRYYRGRKVLHSCVKIQLYLLFLEKEKNRPGRGRILVRNVFCFTNLPLNQFFRKLFVLL